MLDSYPQPDADLEAPKLPVLPVSNDSNAASASPKPSDNPFATDDEENSDVKARDMEGMKRHADSHPDPNFAIQKIDSIHSEAAKLPVISLLKSSKLKATSPKPSDNPSVKPNIAGRDSQDSSKNTNPFAEDGETSIKISAETSATRSPLVALPISRDSHQSPPGKKIEQTTEIRPSPLENSRGTQVAHRADHSSNPFADDDDDANEVTTSPIRSPPHVVSPLLPVSKLTPTGTESLHAFDQKMRLFLHMGYGHSIISEVLRKEHTFRGAAELLASEAKSQKEQGSEPVWKPPFTASIGSWLPAIPDPSGQITHVVYIITVVQNFHVGGALGTLRIEKRFSEFYDLYCKLYQTICLVFPEGMTSPFPDDRLSAWFWGISEDRTHQRRKDLDAWFREVTRSVGIMSSVDSYNEIRRFFALELVEDTE